MKIEHINFLILVLESKGLNIPISFAKTASETIDALLEERQKLLEKSDLNKPSENL